MADLSDDELKALSQATPVPTGWIWWRPVDLMRAAIASDRALNAAPAEPGAACPTCGSDCNERDELIKAEREIERLRGLVAAPAAAGETVAPMLSCDIQPRPLSYPLSDYHRAGFAGPLHFTWADKPHRLLYDLIAAVRYYAAPAAPAEPAPQPEPVNAQMPGALPDIPPHPEHYMAWTDREREAIQQHTAAVVRAVMAAAEAAQAPGGCQNDPWRGLAQDPRAKP